MSHSAFLRPLHRPGVSVSYACSLCLRFSPLRHLFFCTDCRVLLCPCCTDALLDALYCPSCLTSVFSSSAHAALGRCEQCVECPHCGHTLQTAYHSSTQLYSLLCPACRWASYDKQSPQRPSSLAAADVTVLLAAVRARETDDAARSDVQRLTAQWKATFKAVQAEKRSDRQSAAGGPQPFAAPSSSSALTSASLFASAASSYRPASESSGGLQRFLALEQLVAQQRRAMHYPPPLESPPSAGPSSVPAYIKGRFASRAADAPGHEESKEQEEDERVYGIHDGPQHRRPMPRLNIDRSAAV